MKKIKFVENANNLIGQYKSYKDELKKNGIKNSKTETFAKIYFECNNERWKGVPIILRTGKKLPKKYGRITVKLKDKRGKIVINIQPRQDITSKIDNKKKINLSLCKECSFRPNSPDAYEILIEDVVKSDRTLFVNINEIHESWRIVDEIEEHKKKIKFVYYDDGKDPELDVGK